MWRIRPWWPNALGRAQDRGTAHTCPLVHPCRACAADRTPCTHTDCPWWVETGMQVGNRIALRDHLRYDHHERTAP